MRRLPVFLLALALGLAGCAGARAESLEVTATAYNSVPEQTGAQPDIAAWGDRLEPGMRVIAVSRDLLELGLTRGTEVSIDGLEGRWVVRDKMASRWRRRIDLYMGEDVPAARRWGRRKVTIRG
jgi:3D (Asp-Asp-Asp) domain-containing protein